jgi:hypothetical protein
MEKHMTDTNRLIQRLPLGRVVATPGALKALEEANQNAFEFLDATRLEIGASCVKKTKTRMNFRFGTISESSSPYRTQNDVRIWIITEADRSATTLLVPHEY